jgi:predicted nuclease of predicted toxin-antitoxin system
MNLYLDDDSASKVLASLLRQAGHQVATPSDVNLFGASDPRHLLHAAKHSQTMVTRNHDDFEDLHELIKAVGGQHHGILVVRLDNNAARDMKDRDIVRAIANLVNSGAPVIGEFYVLNHWR